MTALRAPTAAPDRPASPRAGREDRPPRIRSVGAVVAIGLVANVAAVLLSLAVGAVLLHIGQVWDALRGQPADALVAGIVDARVDRTVIGLTVGGAVAVSGAVLQGLTRNPLADPGILGLNAGAALAVVLGIRFWGLSSVAGHVWLAIAGVVAAAVLVQSIAMLAPSRTQPTTMALAGAAVLAGTTSVLGGLLVTDRATLDVFRFWQVGSVAGRDASIVLEVVPFLVCGLLLALTSGPVLNATALGDDLARSLGQRVVLQRGLAALGAVLLCAGATALAGPIAFVGLVVPHLVRVVAGPDYRRVLIGSLLWGPALVVVTDVLGRVISQPSEVQVGIMTAVIGAPVLVVLVRTLGRR